MALAVAIPRMPCSSLSEGTASAPASWNEGQGSTSNSLRRGEKKMDELQKKMWDAMDALRLAVDGYTTVSDEEMEDLKIDVHVAVDRFQSASIHGGY